MAWIESHQTLRNHPKTTNAMALLGITDVPKMVGHLHCLWWWALDYAQEGDLTGYSDETIAAAAAWTGDPHAFVRALIDCRVCEGKWGFIEEHPDGRRLLHNWFDYGGRLIAKRRANAERMRARRAAHVQRTCTPRAGATVQDTTEHTVQNSTDRSASQRDISKKADPASKGGVGGNLASADVDTSREEPPEPAWAPCYRRSDWWTRFLGVFEEASEKPAAAENADSLAGILKSDFCRKVYQHNACGVPSDCEGFLRRRVLARLKKARARDGPLENPVGLFRTILREEAEACGYRPGSA